MKLDVVTPKGARISDMDVQEVTLPGFLGEMGILPGHIAMMAGLGVGPMLVKDDKGREVSYALSGGYVEVLGDRVRVLSETCEKADEIDLDLARQKLERARQRLDQLSPADGESYHVALNSVRKHETRIEVAEKAVRADRS